MSGQAKAKTFGFSAAAHFIHRRLGSVSLLFVNDSTFSSTVRPDELHPILIKVMAVKVLNMKLVTAAEKKIDPPIT